MVKLNGHHEYEHLCNVVLSPDKFPIAYNAKLCELINCGLSEEDAKEYIATSKIELELYYSKDYGCFAVESDAVECGATIFDPYTGENFEDYED